MTALAVIVLWAAFIVRNALLIVYVSVLFSIGFSPIVRVIERQKMLPVARRLPRWLAILILYLAILGRTIVWALGSTVICLLVGYPVTAGGVAVTTSAW